ncbi:ABC transporter permease [Methylocapsa sp. S129]|uniref:ABC transporter permease n=1 Tax=Methylocapsa sp. S129 TaxID=1641869 RepID=UPI00131E35DB|nr:ABC transporter permease [Methylocapsa sp. S129]
MTATLRLSSDWLGLAILTLGGAIFLSVLRPDFLSSYNIFVLLDAIALSTMIALGQLAVIALGQTNLSLGSIGGLVGVAFAGAMQAGGVAPWLAVLLGLALGLACGLINGLLTARAGISAFVITLATLAAYKGVNLGLTQAQPLYDIPAVVKAVGTASISGPVPVLLIPAAIAVVFVWCLFDRIPLGRQILAVGANQHAARLAGISVSRAVIATHALSGLLAGAAGMMAVARLQVGQPTIGDDWLIPSFTAPVIGGAILSGGYVSVAGAVWGVALVVLITQALVLFQVDPYYVQFLLGLLILAAVGVNRFRSKRQTKAV